MPGPRVFTVEEANQLLPGVERIFQELDRLKDHLKNTKIRVNALELIWGESLRNADCADNREYLGLMDEMNRTSGLFNVEAAKITALGGVLKGVEPGLIDFYGLREGHLVFLCWQRGEESITHWHHVDTGFSGRQRLDVTEL